MRSVIQALTGKMAVIQRITADRGVKSLDS
jgi:hypothetical protein